MLLTLFHLLLLVHRIKQMSARGRQHTSCLQSYRNDNVSKLPISIGSFWRIVWNITFNTLLLLKESLLQKQHIGYSNIWLEYHCLSTWPHDRIQVAWMGHVFCLRKSLKEICLDWFVGTTYMRWCGDVFKAVFGPWPIIWSKCATW